MTAECLVCATKYDAGFKAAIDEGKRQAQRIMFHWGDGFCYTTSHGHVVGEVRRRECAGCWQELWDQGKGELKELAQCEYCGQMEYTLITIQIGDPYSNTRWEPPIDACQNCRAYLGRWFRYVPKGT